VRAGIVLAGVLPWCWWAGGTETGTLSESLSLPTGTATGSVSLPSDTETSSRSLCPEPIVYDSRCTVQADCSNRAEVTGWNGTRCVCKCRNQWTGVECTVCPSKYNAAQDCGACAVGKENYPECRQRVQTLTVVQSASTWAYPGVPTPKIQVRLLDPSGNPMTMTIPPLLCKATLKRCQMNATTGAFKAGGTCTTVSGAWYAPVSSTGVCDFGEAVFIDPDFNLARRYRLTVESDVKNVDIDLPLASCSLELNQAASRQARPLSTSFFHNNVSVGGVALTDDWRNACPLCALNFLKPDLSSAPRPASAAALGVVLAAGWFAAAL